MSLDTLESLDNSIKRLVDREVSISIADRQKASTTQQYLRQVLRAKSQYDSEFPYLLERTDEDFIGGSFDRHTKIWPLDDIDLYLPLDGSGLIYHYNRQRQPYIVWSDDHSRPNRLTQHAKWMTGTDVDPRKLLNGMHAAIDESYPNSVTTLHAQSVNLSLTVAANAESEGIGLDIVPCFRLSPTGSGDPFYMMPDGIGGWLRTNPRKDRELSEELHNYHNHTYRKAIRLVKLWNKNRMGNAFSSYYIELAICKKFLELKDQGSPITGNTVALYYAFDALRDAFTRRNIPSLIQGAPDVVAPMLGLLQFERLNGVVGIVGSAYREAYTASNIDAAHEHLRQIFGVLVY